MRFDARCLSAPTGIVGFHRLSSSCLHIFLFFLFSFRFSHSVSSSFSFAFSSSSSPSHPSSSVSFIVSCFPFASFLTLFFFLCVCVCVCVEIEKKKKRRKILLSLVIDDRPPKQSIIRAKLGKKKRVAIMKNNRRYQIYTWLPWKAVEPRKKSNKLQYNLKKAQ